MPRRWDHREHLAAGPVNQSTHQNRTLALAGVFQAASLVAQVARRGEVEADPFAASVGSLFAIDAESTEAVYGGVRGVAHGLHTLRRNLGHDTRTRDADVVRYVIGLMHLERKLAGQEAMLQAIREGIETASAQAADFSRTDANVIASLADVYTSTISTLGPRIMVRGEPTLLNEPNNANRIRALLLAGIRSAVLWRQLGGSRLWLLLSRRRVLDTAIRLAASLITPAP
jgi:high frequency lysogenization protein